MQNQNNEQSVSIEQAFNEVNALRNATFETVRDQIVSAFEPTIEEAVALQLFGEAEEKDDKDEDKKDDKEDDKKDSKSDKDKDKEKKSDKKDKDEDKEKKPKKDDESDEDEEVDAEESEDEVTDEDLDELTDEDLGDLNFDEDIEMADMAEDEENIEDLIDEEPADEDIEYIDDEEAEFGFSLDSEDLDIDVEKDVVDIDIGNEKGKDRKRLRFKKHKKQEAAPEEEFELEENVDILDEEFTLEGFGMLNDEEFEEDMPIEDEDDTEDEFEFGSFLDETEVENAYEEDIVETYFEKQKAQKMERELQEAKKALLEARRKEKKLNETIRVYRKSHNDSALFLKKTTLARRLMEEFFKGADKTTGDRIFLEFDKAKTINEAETIYKSISTRAQKVRASLARNIQTVNESRTKRTVVAKKPEVKISQNNSRLSKGVIKEFARHHQEGRILADLPMPGQKLDLTDADRNVVHEDWQRLAGIIKD